MTNGEYIISAFSNATIRKCKNKDYTYIEVEQDDKWIADFNIEWWHSEYNVEDIRQLPPVKPQELSSDIEEIEEIINCDADSETKCKMISNILIAKPHYFEK